MTVSKPEPSSDSSNPSVTEGAHDPCIREMEALGWTYLGEADHGGKMFVMRSPFNPTGGESE